MQTARPLPMFALTVALAMSAALVARPALAVPGAATPEVGDEAPAVTLPDLNGEPHDLAADFASGKTVLVVLRGYPGYQCPACSRQVLGFISLASKFEDAGLKVVLIYPGPSEALDAKADEFLESKALPAPLTMLLDPDYKFVDAYGLRWEAPRETAYPSTFVVAEGGEITFANISESHGGRIPAKEALAAAVE